MNGTASTAQEVTFYDTLNMLSGTQQAALIQAAQEALDSAQSTTVVQPGEQFVHVVGSHTTDIAPQPLHATLHFKLSVGDPELENAICANHYNYECNSLYRFQSQDVTQNCELFCTDPGSYTTFTVPNYWQAIVIAHEYWDFVTLDGHTIATNQPDTTYNLTNSAHLLYLNIIWDGTHWQATFDALQGGSYNSLGCLAANNELYEIPSPVGLKSFGYSVTSATIAAVGCVESVQPTAASPSSSVPVSRRKLSASTVLAFCSPPTPSPTTTGPFYPSPIPTNNPWQSIWRLHMRRSTLSSFMAPCATCHSEWSEESLVAPGNFRSTQNDTRPKGCNED